MIRVLPFFIVFVLPALLVMSTKWGGAWTFLPILITYFGIPLLDVVFEQRFDNPEEGAAHERLFDVPLLLWVPVALGVTVYVLWCVAQGSYSNVEIAGLVISLGVINGAGGINIAHELMHRKHKLHRACAEILMTTVSYAHFCVEHVLGHHRFVATPEDAASSRLGEGFYRFYLRTVFGSAASAWRLERARCAKKQIPWYSLRDRRTRYALVLVAVYAGLYLSLGAFAAAMFGVQSLLGFSLLEVVNYIEHYGLARRKLDNGRYERVRPEHSWNSAHLVSNYYLFNLARHSDHHYLASREYDRLRHHEDAPQMPTGYAGMFMLALIPPLWFRVMDHRVEAWNARRGEQPAPSMQPEARAA